MEQNTIVAEDRLRLQLVTLVIASTFAYWWAWINMGVDVLVNIAAIFMIVPISFSLYLLLLAIAYIPNKKTKETRNSIRFHANFFFTTGIVSFLWGVFCYLTINTICPSFFQWSLHTNIFGFSLFGIPWISGVVLIILWMFQPEKGYRATFKKKLGNK